MSITLYSKYRRQQLRNAWSFAGMSEWCRNIGAGLAAFIAALVFVQWIDDEMSRAEAAERIAEHWKREHAGLESVVLACLNGRGIWIGDKLNLCSIADTHLIRGDFK